MRASSRPSAATSSRSCSRNMADAQAAADRIKSGTSFADIATERGLKAAGHRSRHRGQVEHGRPGSGRCRFRAQGGRSQRAGPGPVRRGARHRAQDRAETTKPLPRWRRSCATRSRSSAPRHRCRTCTTRSRTTAPAAHARRGGAKGEAAGRHLRRRPLRPRPGRQAVADLPHGREIVSGAFASDVGVDNDPIDADGGYVWYDVAAHHAGARPHARRGQGARSSSAGATTRSLRG